MSSKAASLIEGNSKRLSNELNHPDGGRRATAAEQDRPTQIPLALNVAACPTQAGGHSERFSVQF